MTERPLPRSPSAHRALRVLLLVSVGVAAVVGVVLAVTLIPRHHVSSPTPAAAGSVAAASVAASPSPSLDAPPSGATSATAVSAPASDPATSASVAQPDPQAVLKAEVVAAELGFQATLNQELDSDTGNVTPLFAVATGPALANAEDAVAKLRSQGRTQRGAPTITDATVVSFASPTVALVSACEDDLTARIVDAKTGVLIDQLHERYITTTAMVLSSGSWKASTIFAGGAC